MWHCPFKFARDYYVLEDESGQWVASADCKKDLQNKKRKGLKIKKVKYDGCPAFSFDKDDDLL